MNKNVILAPNDNLINTDMSSFSLNYLLGKIVGGIVFINCLMEKKEYETALKNLKELESSVIELICKICHEDEE